MSEKINETIQQESLDVIHELVATTKNGIVRLYVKGDERTIPHFHFPVPGNPDVCICLYENKYYIHANHTKTLDSKTLEAIDEAMRKPCKKDKSITNWESLCLQWKEKNGLLPQYENITTQPDFSKTSGSITD